MRRTRLVLILLILLAWALRLYHLDVQSLWYDEGVTVQVARMGAADLARWTAGDIQPPLYYLLAGGWLRVIQPWEAPLAFTVRFLSAVLGLALLPVLWALGRRLWSHVAGLVAVSVAAISPLMVYYSQEARMYTLLVLLVSLAALAILHLIPPAISSLSSPSSALRPQSSRPLLWWSAYVLAALASLYTHYFAAFALVALAFYWLIQWWRSGHARRALAGFLLAQAAILIGYLPWLPAMLTRFRVDSSYWQGTLKLGDALRHTAINFTAGATETMLEARATALLPWFGLAALLWLVAVWRMPGRPPQRPLLFLLLWGLLPPLCIFFLAYRTPKFNPRYLMISWPVWALLAGGGVAGLWRGFTPAGAQWRWVAPALRSAAVLSLAFVLIVQGAGLRNWFGDNRFAKSDWRDAISRMYFSRQPDEVALLVSGHAYPVFDAYVPAALGVTRHRLPEIDILDVNRVLGWEEVATALNRDLEGAGGVWLFLWQDEVVDPAGVVTTLLDRYAEFVEAPDYPFIGLRHYRLLPDQRFPERPPATGPSADFGGLVRLAGIETTPGGLWLYWQGLQRDLPDLNADLTLAGADGSVLAQQSGRLAGYNFPTTRWQPGATYPVWLPVANEDAAPAQLRLQVFAAGGQVIGEQTLDLTP